MLIHNKTLVSVYHYAISIVFYKPFLKRSSWKFIIINPINITPKYISIGNNVTVRNHARLEGVSKYEGQIFTPAIIIGDDVKIQQNLHLTCAGKITIGNGTAIAANVTISDINHGYEDITTAPERQPITVKEVVIGNNCKLYNNVVVLPGTVLGRHNIVGANSIVGGVYPDYSVIVGAPAKIVKRYNADLGKWEKTDSKGNFIK